MDDKTETLMECIWDDHAELIQSYAPNGLKKVGGAWLTPSNIAKMRSTLEEYNKFFMECITLIDQALKGGNAELEEKISDFLDVSVRGVFAEWLAEEKQSLLIYPQKEEDDDVFTDAQYTRLIKSLLYVEPKSPPPVVVPAPVPAPVPAAVPAPIPESTEPAPTTVAEAIRIRRNTYRRNGRRANRGVTLRSTRARTKTRKVHLAL